MRKIEAELYDAIVDCQNYIERSTQYRCVELPSGLYMTLELHGNRIAVFKEGGRAEITNAGFAANVTHSRLNVWLDALRNTDYLPHKITVKREGGLTVATNHATGKKTIIAGWVSVYDL